MRIDQPEPRRSGAAEMVHQRDGRRSGPGIARKNAGQPEARAAEDVSYLKRSSKAFRALDGAADFVSRSTVVRGSNSSHVLRTSLGDTRARTGFWHSNAA